MNRKTVKIRLFEQWSIEVEPNKTAAIFNPRNLTVHSFQHPSAFIENSLMYIICFDDN